MRLSPRVFLLQAGQVAMGTEIANSIVALRRAVLDGLLTNCADAFEEAQKLTGQGKFMEDLEALDTVCRGTAIRKASDAHSHAHRRIDSLQQSRGRVETVFCAPP
jgi:hypothetical protein